MNRSNSFMKVLVGMVICLFLTTSGVFGYLACNGAGGGYCDPGVNPDCPEGSSDSDESTIKGVSIIQSDSTIEANVEEGGGYFFNAFLQIMKLSNRVEMSNLNGVDHDELLNIVNEGLDNIRYAKYSYELLIYTAEATPYNQNVIALLKNFDYKGLMVKDSLNKTIFAKVESYLRNGDITGALKHFYSGIVVIEGLIMQIKVDLSKNRMPELSDVWKVNEAASSNLLFGQGVARVFSALKNN